MTEGYASTRGGEGLTFKSVVMSYLYRLSELTSKCEPMDFHADTLWAHLEPFLTEEDHEIWVEETSSLGIDQYQVSMNKLKVISLVLYKYGLLPPKEHIYNKKYKLQVERGKREDKGLTAHVIEDIEISQFFMRHMILMSYLTANQKDYGVHIDVLWSILSPYATEEDYNDWESNNMTFGKEGSWSYNPYVWNIEKVKICMKVLDRADFLWKTGVVDRPEELIGRDGEIGIRGRI